jgi:NAD(P)-dependent dehydrogenase (short-subunit alcohol dehydrogenase family)
MSQVAVNAASFVTAMFGMTGKVVAVTGGASGLGAGWSKGFSRAGAHVVVVDRNRSGAEEGAAQLRHEGGSAEGYELDVTKSDQVSTFADWIIDRHGHIDVLLNSAGAGYRAPIEKFPEAALDSVIALNLKGTYLMCQAVGRKMLEAGSGSIINVASIGAFIAYPHASAYLASKGAVVQITRGLALEWVNRGVRVNAIAPSLCATPLVEGLDAMGTTITTDYVKSRMPRQKLIEPEELVSAALFLASPASSRVTGHILAVDDGYLAA